MKVEIDAVDEWIYLCCKWIISHPKHLAQVKHSENLQPK